MPDRIERETRVRAPVERVWAVLTEPGHMAAWLGGVSASVELRPGGAMVMTWKEHGTFHGRVVEVQPPHKFSYRWALLPDEPPTDGNSTLVEFTLLPEGEQTRLQVVESGFVALAGTEASRQEHHAVNIRGWEGGLSALVAYLGERT